MKIFNVMFRNGDGVSLRGKAARSDGKELIIVDDRRVIAVFFWEAIVGFVIKEDEDGTDKI